MALSAIAGLSTIGSAMVAAGTFAIGWTAAFQAFAIGVGLTAVSRALTPKPDAQNIAGLTENIRSPISSKKLIYGKTRVGGTLVMMGSSGDNNEYLTLVMAIAGHRVNAFKEVYLNDDKVWDADATPNYQGIYYTNPSDPTAIPLAALEFIIGSDTNITSSLATLGINDYTSNHTMNGNAAIVVQLHYDPEVYTQGIPKITCVVEGNRVYDPRQNENSPYYDSSIGSGHRPNGAWHELGYTTNPALILLDYIRDEKYGLGESTNNIDVQSFVDAANVCDEDVNLADGGTQKRYTCDGVLDTQRTIKANIEDILSTMIGTLTLVGGKYVLNAYEYKTPSLDINETMLTAPLVVTTRQSRRNLYNAVKGTYVASEDNYTPTDYPAQVSSAYATDDGETVYLDMTLPMTTDNIRAQRIARLTMLKSRLQATVQMTLNLTGLKIKVGDNIRLSNARLGYTNKIFEVVSFNLIPDEAQGLSVSIEAVENASDAYDWQTSDELDFTTGGEVELYNGRTAEPVTNLTLDAFSDVHDDGSITPAVGVSWTNPEDAYTDRYEITWQNVTDTSPIYKQTTLASPFVVSPVAASKTYTITVKAINERGVRSTAASANVTTTSDYQPRVPSLYRIEKSDSNAPTASEFTTVAGREPKDKDAVITKDTSTTPNSAHAWTYDATTGTWTLDDDFFSGDLIINGSVVTDNIADLAITNGKINDLNADKITAGTIDASVVTVSNLNADNISAGTLSADQIQVDGVTLDSDATGNLIVKGGGISSTQLDSLAVTNAKLAVDAIQANVIKAGEIGTVALADLSVDVDKIAEDAVTNAKIAQDAVENAQIAVDAIQGDVIAASAITSGKIADDAVTTDKLEGLAVTTAKIANDAIDNAKIADDAVENAQIAVDAIQGDVIAAGAITETKIEDDAITTAKINAGAVTATEISASTITANEIAGSTITATEILGGTITASEIAADAITANEIAANTITASEILGSTITASEIAGETITASEIAADAITSEKIVANAVTANEIAGNTITANEILGSTITATEIAGSTITATEIAGNTITANEIAALAITTDELAANAVTSAKIVANTITADEIAGNTITASEILGNSITASEIAGGTITATEIQALTITGAEIAADTITGGKIAADTIEVSKLTGDVSEVFPVMFYLNDSFTTSSQYSDEFTLHAPELVAKKPKVALRIDYKIHNQSSSSVTQVLVCNIEIKVKAATATQIGATSGVTLDSSATTAFTIYVSGDHTNKMDYVGGVADSATGSNGIGQVIGLRYDVANDRTYITYSQSNSVVTTGETLYWHPYAWASAGTFKNIVTKENIGIFASRYATTQVSEYISIMFAETDTATTFRIKYSAPTMYTQVTPYIMRATGTLELIA